MQKVALDRLKSIDRTQLSGTEGLVLPTWFDAPASVAVADASYYTALHLEDATVYQQILAHVVWSPSLLLHSRTLPMPETITSHLLISGGVQGHMMKDKADVFVRGLWPDIKTDTKWSTVEAT